MLVYLFLAVFIAFLHVLRPYQNLRVIFVVLILISALRDETVGIDYLAYQEAFYREISASVPVSILVSKFELGWIFLNILVQYFSGKFEVLIAIVSVLTITPVLYVLKKETARPVFAVLLYVLLFYYTLPFSLIKQGVAISFFLLAAHYINKGKKLKSVIPIAVSGLIHYSSLALIPILILARKLNLSTKKVLIILAGTFLVGILGLSDSLRDLIELLPFEKYANYADYKADVKFDRVNLYLFLLPKNIMCGLIFAYLPTRDQFYKNLLFIGLVISNLFVSISLISRFVLYLYPFEIILLAGLAYCYKGQKKSQFQWVIIIYAVIYFIYNLYTNRGGIVPYDVFF